MGRQWLHAKRLVAGLKKGRTTGKLVREISVAAKMGGPDPDMNPRLFTAVEKAKKESVTKDAIQRAINKGAGIGEEKLVMEHVLYEGRAPHNVPVIVEVYTDNVNRTAPEIRVLFKSKDSSAPPAATSFSLTTSALSRRIIRTRPLTAKPPPSKPARMKLKR